MKKRVLYQMGFVVLATVVIASAFYYLLCAGLRQARQDSVGKFNYLMQDSTYYSTVFFGASTIHVGINPQLFDSITGTHSYNASLDGLGITEISAIIKRYTNKHGAPSTVFIAVDENTLGVQLPVWAFPQYYPFMGDSDLNGIITREPKLILGKYFPAAAVTYFDDPLKNLGLIGLLKGGNKPYNIPLKGFAPAYVNGSIEDMPATEITFAGSAKGWQLLEETLGFCKQRNINVNFIIPPIYNVTLSDSSQRFIARLNSYQQNYGTRAFNFVGEYELGSKNLFPNRTHVNADGAQVFTTLLAKQYLMVSTDSLEHLSDSTKLYNYTNGQ